MGPLYTAVGVGISVALGIILLLILIAIIVYVVYYFMDESAIASRKTKAAKANVFTYVSS